MKAMNNIQLTDYLPDYSGNFGDTLIALAKKCSMNKYKCYVSFPEPRTWHQDIKKAGGEVFYLDVFKFKDKKIDTKSIRFLRKFCLENNIQILHVHFGLSQKIATLILKIFNHNLKIIWHWRGDIDDSMANYKKIQTFIFYRAFANHFVNAHIANSKYIAKRLIDKKLVSKHKLYSLHNAINVKKFNYNNFISGINHLISLYNTSNIFTLIMIRNFRKRVDFDIILETMSCLKKLPDNIQLLWIGYGDAETEIKARVVRMGLNNIHFIGRVKNPIPYYFISKINIIAWEPWCNETINNTAYEALACNLPVVGLNFGGLINTFSESEGVFTVPLDPVKYAKKIIYIKNNYYNILSNVEHGKNKIIKKYSLDSYVDKLINIYSS
jgi:glycosyltransferase involved in cell wall biosynthesis